MGQSLEEFLEKLDIVDVISHYLSLKRVGNNYMAPCPFHNETKPSFSVSHTRQFYHCFGCGAGGNAIQFIRNYENVDFKDAVRILSQRYNIPFTFSGSSKTDGQARTKEREEIQQAFSFLFAIFHQYLFKQNQEACKALKYLQDRGFDKDIIEHFQLGYIPLQGQAVIKRLKQTYPDLTVFNKLGILGKREDGSFYCKLTGRITFPIYDQLGRGIALGARVITTGEPKYINSPENILFQKSKVFYGWHLAKSHVNKRREIIISEGYFDVIRLHQKEFNHSIATLGTALSEHHARLLKRTNAMIYLVFDADDAGIKAALRGVTHLLRYEIPYRIILLPPGEDPDSYLHKNPHDSFSRILKDGYNIIELLYKHTLDKEGFISLEKKNEIIRTVLPMIQGCPNSILQEEYLAILSRLLGVGQHTLQYELKNLRKMQRYKKEEQQDEAPQKRSRPQTPEEKILKKLIAFFILDNNLVPLYKQAIDFKLLEDTVPKNVLMYLLEMEPSSHENILNNLDVIDLPQEHKTFILGLMMDHDEYWDMEESALAEHSFAYLEKLAHLEVKKKILYHKNLLRLARNASEKKRLFEQLHEYSKLKNTPREYLKNKLKELKNNEFADLDQ